MHCRLLTQYTIIMVEFLARLRKIKLHAAATLTGAVAQTKLQSPLSIPSQLLQLAETTAVLHYMIPT